MRCTRSPACVCLFLLARLSSGLGDRCRYPHPTKIIAKNVLQFQTRHVLIVVAMISTFLSISAYIQYSTDWNRYVSWNHNGIGFDLNRISVFESWIRSLAWGACWSILVFAVLNSLYSYIFSVTKLDK
jgi:hypothetical protein